MAAWRIVPSVPAVPCRLSTNQVRPSAVCCLSACCCCCCCRCCCLLSAMSLSLSMVVDLPLPAACPAPSRVSDWCGSLPAFITAGWRGSAAADSGTSNGNKRRLLGQHCSRQTPTVQRLVSAALPLWPAADEAPLPAPQQQQQSAAALYGSTDDEHSTASQLLRRHSARSILSRRPTQPSLPLAAHRQPALPQPPPLTAAVLPHHARALAPSPSHSQSAAGSDATEAAAELTDSSSLASLSALPRPLRRPLPSAAFGPLEGGWKTAERGSGGEPSEAVSGGESEGGKRPRTAEAERATFQAFDYEAAVQSVAQSATAASVSASSRPQQRKRREPKPASASAAAPPSSSAHSSRYSGRSRGRQFKA